MLPYVGTNVFSLICSTNPFLESKLPKLVITHAQNGYITSITERCTKKDLVMTCITLTLLEHDKESHSLILLANLSSADSSNVTISFWIWEEDSSAVTREAKSGFSIKWLP